MILLLPWNMKCLITRAGSTVCFSEKSKDDISNVVLIELKQWSNVKALAEEGNFVETYTGGRERVVPHPSQQVKGYHYYMQGFVEEFEKEPTLTLFSCAYCHNYSRTDGKGLA